MKKSKKIKSRRPLNLLDFRKRLRQEINTGLVLVKGDGCIDVDKIIRTFPRTDERLEYINALIQGLSE